MKIHVVLLSLFGLTMAFENISSDSNTSYIVNQCKECLLNSTQNVFYKTIFSTTSRQKYVCKSTKLADWSIVVDYSCFLHSCESIAESPINKIYASEEISCHHERRQVDTYHSIEDWVYLMWSLCTLTVILSSLMAWKSKSNWHSTSTIYKSPTEPKA
jgi:hypothetical protein